MKRNIRRYNEEERRFLRENIPGRSYAEIISLFNAWDNRSGEPLTETQLKAFIKNNHVNTGRTGRFKKGSVPFNKGKKGLYTSNAATKFKKGQMPHNYLPVGSERVNTDGYVEIKIADPNKWRGKHLLTWEEHHGPVPKGHAVIFGDGNKNNTAIENLVLVTRAELAMLNKFKLIGNSADLTKTGVLVADLRMKLYGRRKGKK